jgi:hypothetical protein
MQSISLGSTKVSVFLSKERLINREGCCLRHQQSSEALTFRAEILFSHRTVRLSSARHCDRNMQDAVARLAFSLV